MLAALRHISFPVCAFVYVFSKNILNADPKLRFIDIIHEDEVFTPDLLLRCGETIVSNAVLYHRRVRKNSIMTTPASIKNVTGNLIASRKWLERARVVTGKKASVFRMQAHRFYGNAMRYTARAEMDLGAVRAMVQKENPEFERFVTFDYFLSRFSRRAVADFCNLRGQFLERCGL